MKRFMIKYERFLTVLTFLIVATLSSWNLSSSAYSMPDVDQKRIDELYERVAPFEELCELVAAKVRPSVVHISTTATIKSQRPRSPHGRETPLERYFEEFFGRRFDVERKLTALGSGFVVDSRGYVLTNNHVIANADSIKVKLMDGRVLDAEVVGADKPSELAVLKVDTGDGDLPALMLGDSTRMRVGQGVLAFGSPFGLEETVTRGIISAKARIGIGLADYEDFIQTDAAINPGNSGGPLVNLRGEVIGINTAIVTGSGSSAGVGFAIPSSMAKKIMQDLIKKGKVVRGWLGVELQDFTPELAEQFGLIKAEGALISKVFPDNPAARGGIQHGDVIVEFDGREIVSSKDLKNIVATTEVNKEVKVKVIRDRKPVTHTVVIGERPLDIEAFAMGQPAQSKDLGMTVQELTPELADTLGYGKDAKGILVAEVESDSPADNAGIERGDIIEEANQKRVETLADYRKALENADMTKGILLLVRKLDEGTVYLVVKEK